MQINQLCVGNNIKDSTFKTLSTLKATPNMNALQEEREQSVSQSISHLSESLVIPPIVLDEDVVNTKPVKNKSKAQNVANSMKMFTEKIANCASKFGHDIGRMPEKKKQNVMDNDDDREDEDEFATMVVHKNKKQKSSLIPESQIVISDVPPPTTMIIPVNKFLSAESTQTMIVKDDNAMKQSKSLESQLAHIHQSSDGGMLSEDSEDSSDDDDHSGKDPIDASEDEEVMQQRRVHRKNLSTVSDKSHHDRRTMVINDDLDIQNLMIEENVNEDDRN